MENYQLSKNKLWTIYLPKDHYHIHVINFNLIYDDNGKIHFKLSIKPDHSYPEDFEGFYINILDKNKWDKIIINTNIYSKEKTRYLGKFIEKICNTLDIEIHELEISMNVNDIDYSKYKISKIAKYKYKSIDDYYYDFQFEQIV